MALTELTNKDAVSVSLVSVTSLADLAARKITKATSVYLELGGRSGTFSYDATVSAGTIATDPLQGVYVASDFGGAWVRANLEYVTFEMFGVDGTGVSSAVAACSAALSLELPILPCPTATYLIDSQLTVTDKDIKILDSQGATFKYLGDSAQLYFKYSYSDIAAITAVDNTAAVNMSNGTAATTTEVTKLTLVDASIYSAKDKVKIVADDILWGTDPADTHRVGEHAVIYSIVGNDIYLDRRLVANAGAYNTTPRIAKCSTKSCSLGGFTIDGNSANNTTRFFSHVRVEGCANFSTPNLITSKNTQATVLNVESCYLPQIQDFYSSDGVTNSAVGAFAHSVLATSGTTDIKVNSVVGRNMRHLFDTTAVPTTLADDVSNYGGVVGGYIDNILGVGMQASPASTHSDADNIRFGSVVSITPIHGPNGKRAATGFRGRNHHVDYTDCDNGESLFVFTDYGSPDNSRGHTAGSVVNRSNGQGDQSRAVYVVGQTGGVIDLITIDEVICKYNGNKSSVARAERGSILINKVTVTGSCFANTVYLFDANIEGSIEVDRLIGRDMGLFSLFDLSDDTSRGVVHSLDVETASTWGELADLNGTDAYLRVWSARFSQVGTSSDLISNRGAGADIIADWVMTDSAQTTSSNRRRLVTTNINAASAFSMDLSDSGAPVIYAKVVASVAGGSITAITSGTFFGQELVVFNDTTSTESFDVVSNDGGFALAAPVTLAVGEALRGFWDGFRFKVSG